MMAPGLCVSPAARLYFEQHLDDADVVAVGTGTAAVISRRGPGKATANEDAAAVIPCGEQAAVLVVADGVGGMAAGEQASRLAIETLGEHLIRAVETATLIRTAILNAIEDANRRIQALGSNSATTLAILEIAGNCVRPYHVGDSMILVVGGRGKVKLQTISHSPVGYGVESGLLAESDAIHHADRHLVSNFVGSASMRIELGPELRLAPRDTALVASDGLFDNLLTEEIVGRVCRGPIGAAARVLADSALQRMTTAAAAQPSKPDDLSLVLFRPQRVTPASSV